MSVRGVSLLSLLLVLQGCSSSYEPARSPRIAFVVDGGTPRFVKDGVHSGSLVFGTGLVDLVSGNPRAEQQARVGRNLAIGGFVLDLVGLTSEISALAVLAHNPEMDQPRPVATTLAIGGLISVAVGTVFLLEAPPRIYDAVNIYNDRLRPSQ